MSVATEESGFSRRALAWMAGIAVASLLAGVLLAAFGESLSGRPNPGQNSFSSSAVGHRALAETLRRRGLGVVSRRNAAEGKPGPHRPLIVAEPATGWARDEARLHRLRSEAAERQAPLVLVLPKWDYLANERPDWVSAVTLRPVEEVGAVPGALGIGGLERVTVRRPGKLAHADCRARLGGRERSYRVALPWGQLIQPGPGLDPVVVCGNALLVARVKAAPVVYLIADPDLLNNQGLGKGDHARLVDDLLVRGLEAHGVLFEETVHGLARQAGLAAEALRFPLLLASLQSLLLAGAVLWAGMGRFGKPRPARGGAGLGPEVLIDNTAQLLGHGRHAAESLARYYRQTVRTVAAACFLPPDLPEDELVERLERLSRERGVRVQLRPLARRVEAAAAGGGRAAGTRAVRLARHLHRWRLEMMDGQHRHP
jgi:hypothetical protein